MSKKKSHHRHHPATAFTHQEQLQAAAILNLIDHLAISLSARTGVSLRHAQKTLVSAIIEKPLRKTSNEHRAMLTSPQLLERVILLIIDQIPHGEKLPEGFSLTPAGLHLFAHHYPALTLTELVTLSMQGERIQRCLRQQLSPD